MRWSGTVADRVWLVVSALFWAIGSLVARHGARPPPWWSPPRCSSPRGARWCCWRALGAGELAGWSLAQVTPRAALALAFLVVGGTVLGFGAYTWLLQVTTPAAVGSYAFVNPVIALALAWLVGDGVLTGPVLLAAAIVVGAVVLTWAPGRCRIPSTARRSGAHLAVAPLRHRGEDA